MEFIDYDPLTGLRYLADFHPDGGFTFRTEQDVEPFLDYTQKLRNEGVHDNGVKGEFFHYAKIPNVVALELRKRGLNLYSPDETMQKRIRQVIEAEFPYCKTTYLKHV